MMHHPSDYLERTQRDRCQFPADLPAAVWHRSVCRPPAVKVVAGTDGIHHHIDAEVAGHLAGIRKVEVAGAETNLPGVGVPVPHSLPGPSASISGARMSKSLCCSKPSTMAGST